jgi:hypothetical protein
LAIYGALPIGVMHKDVPNHRWRRLIADLGAGCVKYIDALVMGRAAEGGKGGSHQLLRQSPVCDKVDGCANGGLDAILL